MLLIGSQKGSGIHKIGAILGTFFFFFFGFQQGRLTALTTVLLNRQRDSGQDLGVGHGERTIRKASAQVLEKSQLL